MPATLLPGGAPFAVALLLGVPLGKVAVLRRNPAADRAVMRFAVFGFSAPHVFLGILVIPRFTMRLRWRPSAGSGSWQHMGMPPVTLDTAFAGTRARFPHRDAGGDGAALPAQRPRQGRQRRLRPGRPPHPVPPPWLWGGRWAYPLGTGALGRDMLSRLICGIRFSILIAVAGTLIGALVRDRLDPTLVDH